MNQPSRFRRLLAGLVLAVAFALLATSCVDSSPDASAEQQDDGVHVNAPVSTQLEEERHSEVSPIDASLDTSAEPQDDDAPANPPVSVRFEEEWRSERPPNVTAVSGRGYLRGSGFPAVSSDSSHIALLYDGAHPLEDGYPIFELWSTQPISLLRQMPLFPNGDSSNTIVTDIDSLEAMDTARQNIAEVNHILEQEGFAPMVILFDQWLEHGPLVDYASNGKIINYPGTGGGASLEILSSSGELELKLEMPVIPVITESEIPFNNCSVQGSPPQAWYAPEQEVVVVRMTFISARDGCDLPEQWLLRRLRGKSVGGLP